MGWSWIGARGEGTLPWGVGRVHAGGAWPMVRSWGWHPQPRAEEAELARLDGDFGRVAASEGGEGGGGSRAL